MQRPFPTSARPGGIQPMLPTPSRNAMAPSHTAHHGAPGHTDKPGSPPQHKPASSDARGRAKSNPQHTLLRNLGEALRRNNHNHRPERLASHVGITTPRAPANPPWWPPLCQPPQHTFLVIFSVQVRSCSRSQGWDHRQLGSTPRSGCCVHPAPRWPWKPEKRRCRLERTGPT